MDAQKPVKTGILASSPGRDRQDWLKQFYVLYPDSQTNKARLDWFTNETAFKNEPLIRKTIFIEEIKSVKATNIDGRSHGFEIETLRRDEPFLFSANTKKDMKTWIDQLNKLLNQRRQNPPAKNPQGGDSHLGDGVYGNELWSFDEEPEEFKITIGETDSAQACNISNKEHTLQVYSHSMVLKDGKTKTTLYVWPYKYIRRYGRSRTSFTFEAGRRCASGEGVFILYSAQSEEIFNEVQRGNTQGGVERAATLTPDIPMRSYGDNYGEVVMEKRYQKLKSNGQVPPSDYKRLPEQTSQHKATGPPPKSELRRERSNSGSSDKAGPPLPMTARPPIRDQQPLPISKTYVEPPKMMRSYDDDDETYSSIEEETSRAVAGLMTSDEGYSTPVLEDGSMAAIAAQIRMNADRGKMTVDDEYDEVRLNVMMKASNAAKTPAPQVYGQLYGQMAPAQQQAKSTKSVDDDYDEVRTT